MKMLNGDAVAYIANGTYSSIMRLVVHSDTPQPKPDINLEIVNTAKFMNCVVMAPTVKMMPVSSRVLRLPYVMKMLAENAPAQAPILYTPCSV